MSKTNYFARKNELKKRAKQWTSYMDYNYKVDIDNSEMNTIIYPKDFSMDIPTDKVEHTNIEFVKMDTVSAIVKYANSGYKMCALNFASYKNPGGKFMEGSSAQEECLCHESFLYNVLKRFDDNYYAKNRKDVNKSLYYDNLLYSKFILFFKDKFVTPCDVITCAAPNKTAAIKYHNVSEDEITNAMMGRLHSVLQAACDQKVDTLILGAFGCGVFGNNPYDVASMLYILLNSTFKNCFRTIVIAIPKMNDTDTTFDDFKKAFYKFNINE